VELLDKQEETVHRVATRSSTKSRVERHKDRERRRKERSKTGIASTDPEEGDSNHSVRIESTQPIENFEKGVERYPTDVSQEVRRSLGNNVVNPEPIQRKVTFDDIPVVINPDLKVDEYDIIQDIKDQKANVTIGQLLHDNTNYQKLIRDAWTAKRKRRLKLPSVAINFSQVEDYGAPELDVEVGGCIVSKVPVDSGSDVNLILEDTAFNLEYTSFQVTDQVLRMANQSRVHPVGRLSNIPTRIKKETYLLNYVIIRVSKGRPFPMLLGRPWLYLAKVLVD